MSVAITRLLPYPWKIKLESLQEDSRSYHGRSCLSSSSFLFSMHYRWNNSVRTKGRSHEMDLYLCGSMPMYIMVAYTFFSVYKLAVPNTCSIAVMDRQMCLSNWWLGFLFTPLRSDPENPGMDHHKFDPNATNLSLRWEGRQYLYNCMALFSLSSGVILSSVMC